MVMGRWPTLHDANPEGDFLSKPRGGDYPGPGVAVHLAGGDGLTSRPRVILLASTAAATRAGSVTLA